ncbi:MAG: winged helix-turn-helix transcriptional regulator [Candidatus Poribacteria bacterium]
MPVIHVGAIGQSVWRSDDGGASFRIRSKGMWAESDIRALTIQPGRGGTIYAGSNNGVYKSTDGGDSWARAGSELAGREVWSVGVSHLDGDLIVAGTCPGGLYACHPERLVELEEIGMVERKVDVKQRPVLVEYASTQMARELSPVFDALQNWAEKWMPGGSDA